MVRFDALLLSAIVGLREFGKPGTANMEGTRGTDGTDDLRLDLTDLGGAGKSISIFASKDWLLVSAGNNFLSSDAVLGNGGSGGSVVGLPEKVLKMDDRDVITEAADFVRL